MPGAGSGNLDLDKLYVTPFLDQNLSFTTGAATPATYYYTQDGLGSVRTVSNSSGTVVDKYDYLAFGSPFGGNPSTASNAPGTSVSVSQ
ncbi:MAG: hypothetical protein V1918_00340, partial [Planctomycetota bacterium]